MSPGPSSLLSSGLCPKASPEPLPLPTDRVGSESLQDELLGKNY